MRLLISVALVFFALPNNPVELVKVLTREVQHVQDEKKVTAIIEEAVDVKSLASMALGDLKRKARAGEVKEYHRLFHTLFVQSSVRKILGKKSDHTRIYPAVKTNNTSATVKAVIYYRGEKVEVIYFLHKKNKLWKIYYMEVDGTRITENFHSQFSRIIERDGFTGLLKKLRNKVNKLRHHK